MLVAKAVARKEKTMIVTCMAFDASGMFVWLFNAFTSVLFSWYAAFDYTSACPTGSFLAVGSLHGSIGQYYCQKLIPTYISTVALSFLRCHRVVEFPRHEYIFALPFQLGIWDFRTFFVLVRMLVIPSTPASGHISFPGHVTVCSLPVDADTQSTVAWLTAVRSNDPTLFMGCCLISRSQVRLRGTRVFGQVWVRLLGVAATVVMSAHQTISKFARVMQIRKYMTITEEIWCFARNSSRSHSLDCIAPLSA